MTFDIGAQQPAARPDQLKQLTDTHAPILQQLSEGVIIAGIDGRLMFVNEAAERLHGVKQLDVAPDDYSRTYSLFTMDGQPYPFADLPLARAVAHGETVDDARWRIRRPDGSEVVAIGSARPLIGDGGQFGAILNLRDDSERYEAERRLRESEQRLRLVIDGASDYAIFTTDAARIVTSWSRGAELAFQYAASEIIGECADILWVPEDRTSNQPEQEAETARASGCANNERWHQRKDGSRVFMNGSVHPLPPNPDGSEGGFIKIAQDETERRAFEEALRQRTTQFENLFDDSPLGIYLLDSDFRIRQVNPVARQVLADIPQIEGRDFVETVRKLWDKDFAGAVIALFRRTLATGVPYFCADPIERHFDHGVTRYYEWQINRIVLPEGGHGIACYFRDISAQILARNAMAESEARFRNMADHAPVMMWVTDPDGQSTYLNRAWHDFTGQTETQALGFGWLDAVHPDDAAEVERAFLAANASAAPFRIDYRLRRADGSYRWAIDAAAPRFGPDGGFLGYVGSVIDIHERKVEESLGAARNRILELAVEGRPLQETLGELITVIEHQAGGEVLGSILLLDRDGQRLRHGAAPSLPDAFNVAIDGIEIGHGVGSCGTAASSGEAVFVVDIASDPLWKDCKDLALEHGLRACWSIPILGSEDTVLGTFAMYHRQPKEPTPEDLRLVDFVTRTAALIIERRTAADALRERSEEFFTLADNIPTLAWMAYANGDIFWYNRRWYEYTGTTPETQIGWGWEAVHHPDILPTVVERWTASLQSGAPFEMTFPLRGSDGRFRTFLTRVIPIRDEAGEIIRWFGTNTDISAQHEAEEALRLLNETLELRVTERTAERDRVWRVSQDLFVICGFDGHYRMVNPAWTTQLGYTEDELIGERFDTLVHPDDFDVAQAQFQKLMTQAVLSDFDIRLRAKDGTYRSYSWTCVPEEGSFYAAGRDVTQRKNLEEALRQSQKMETLGQLTGGIAHDFNNLLQIITGNLDILRRAIPTDSPRLHRSVENAFKGAERAAVLTQRLLAFSRRQPLVPKVINANKLVSGMSELLHRALGETIEIETVLGSGLWRVEADANQLENALLNLAVNSRDAMPGGGKLTIETANTHLDRSYADQNSGVVAGQYVVICVSDTGTGMDPDTAERAFDPFFTTKEVGKGTGLGLSMVYGFVKQSGGHLKIYTELAEGTTVKIYLPRHHGEETDDADEAEGISAFAPAGVTGETILVCEDDEDVRAYSAHSLRELGYQVIEAADGPAALRLLESSSGSIDLLFTDIVLPGGMTGAAVAERAREIQPDLKVLFTTGYARNAIVHHGRVDPGVELLSKPFSYADLAARVRELLDARQP